MSAIKKLFERKKINAKFKMAGSGHKLGNATSTSTAAAQTSLRTNNQTPTRRQPPEAEASQSAAAAMTRLRLSNQENDAGADFAKRRSQAAIKAMAKKEIEEEDRQIKQALSLKATYGTSAPYNNEDVGPLACSGIFYRCSLFEGPALPKAEMLKEIRKYLYDQLTMENVDAEDKASISALIIHTCNTDTEKVNTCIDTICTYIDNILSNPDEEKFRKIRKKNKNFVKKVAELEGTDLFLAAAGFKSQIIDDEDFWVWEGCEAEQFELLSSMRENLIIAEPVRAELDRNVRVLFPHEADNFSLPKDFFNITTSEIRNEQQERSDAVERESMLRTQAMREKEKSRNRKKYRFTLIRVRFPDGLILQGTFSAYENFSLVRAFVNENLSHELPFVLYEAGSNKAFGNCNNEEEMKETSLLDLGMVPSTLLTFAWHSDIASDVAAAKDVSYLKKDLVASFSSLSTDRSL